MSDWTISLEVFALLKAQENSLYVKREWYFPTEAAAGIECELVLLQVSTSSQLLLSFSRYSMGLTMLSAGSPGD